MNVCLAIKIIQTSLIRNWKRNSRTYLTFLKMTLVFCLLLRKRCLSLLKYGWLGKINETTKQQKLEQLKTRRYYRWKLHISKKSLQRFWNK